MDIELYNLIFEARKYDNVIYNENGSIKYIMNIEEISDEFLEAESLVQMLSYLVSNEDCLYQSMIDSYVNQTKLNNFQRRNYVLGMTYAKLFEPDISINSQTEFGNLVNKRWNNYKSYALKNLVDIDFIDDFSFLGILDQSKMGYNQNKSKNKK